MSEATNNEQKVTIELDDFNTGVFATVEVSVIGALPDIIIWGSTPYMRNHFFNAVYQPVSYLSVPLEGE